MTIATMPVFACNLKAISTTERPRYNDLVKRFRSATRDCRELPDGYAFELDSKAISLSEVAEWISMERICCPFLTLQLPASGDQVDWLLNLTGPKGVKPFSKPSFRPVECRFVAAMKFRCFQFASRSTGI